MGYYGDAGGLEPPPRTVAAVQPFTLHISLDLCMSDCISSIPPSDFSMLFLHPARLPCVAACGQTAPLTLRDPPLAAAILFRGSPVVFRRRCSIDWSSVCRASFSCRHGLSVSGITFYTHTVLCVQHFKEPGLAACGGVGGIEPPHGNAKIVNSVFCRLCRLSATPVPSFRLSFTGFSGFPTLAIVFRSSTT